MSRLPGKERDAETGLDYFGARYFSGRSGDLRHPTRTPAAAVFQNSAAGEAALRALLATPAVQGRSIAKETKTFAPSTDSNDPEAHAAAIGKALGVDPNLPMSKLTPEQVDAFVETVNQREGFYDSKGTSVIVK